MNLMKTLTIAALAGSLMGSAAFASPRTARTLGRAPATKSAPAHKAKKKSGGKRKMVHTKRPAIKPNLNRPGKLV